MQARQVIGVGAATLASAALAVTIVVRRGGCDASEGTPATTMSPPAPPPPRSLPRPACALAGDLTPSATALAGDTFAFCLGAHSCFVANLATRTLVAAAPLPPQPRPPNDACTVTPKPDRGRGVTVCTVDMRTCHDFPVDERAIAGVTSDAAVIATVVRSPRSDSPPDRITTWHLGSGTRIASFAVGCYESAVPEAGVGGCYLAFLGHALLAYKMPCAQPCSTGHLYDVRGRELGTLAVDPSNARIDRFHDDVYLLQRGPSQVMRDRTRRTRGFAVQDMATGKVLLDVAGEALADATRIVAISAEGAPTVRVWDRDVHLVMEIAVPMCPP